MIDFRLDVEGDGDLDILGTIEEHSPRDAAGDDVSRCSVLWFENPLR